MRRSGFTLIETVVTLGLLASMLVIAVYRFPSTRPPADDETVFWQKYATLWQTRVFVASAYDYQQLVQFNPREVVFAPAQPGVGPATVRLALPATLHLANRHSTSEVSITKNGHPSLAAVYYQSILHPKILYKLSVKMGWGGYVLEKISI